MLKWLEKYFTFTRGERNAIVMLLILSAVVLLFPKVYFFFRPVQHAGNSPHQKEIEAFARQNNSEEPKDVEAQTDSISATPVEAVGLVEKDKAADAQYFEFDPNKIGLAEWQKLGFSEKDAGAIEKYKAKGGKFYRVQDLLRLYCMTEEHYNALKSFVKIDVSALPQRNYDKY